MWDMPSWLVGLLIFLAAVGYLWGQIEAARAMMRMFDRRQRAKIYGPWVTEQRRKPGVSQSKDYEDNLVVIRHVAEGYEVAHLVCGRAGETVLLESVFAPSIEKALPIFDDFCTRFLTYRGRVDGGQLPT